MCLFEFDQEKYEKTLKMEGRMEGRLEGRLEGIKQMIIALYSVGVSKETICEKLLNQYSLSNEEAQKALNKYLPTVN